MKKFEWWKLFESEDRTSNVTRPIEEWKDETGTVRDPYVWAWAQTPWVFRPGSLPGLFTRHTTTKEEIEDCYQWLMGGKPMSDVPRSHQVPEKDRQTAREFLATHVPLALESLYSETGRKLEHKVDPFELPPIISRQTFESGMQRDTALGKIMYDLIFDGPLLERYAVHLTKGAHHYSARNWMKANGQEELGRFRQSAARHFFQWMRGDTDEDHAAAVVFNINGYLYVQEKLKEQK